MPFEIDRSLYARMYGPAVGDRVRLGDTNLVVEVERDEASPGDEALWGFGKTSDHRGHADGAAALESTDTIRASRRRDAAWPSHGSDLISPSSV
jgi:urease alpha subunit